MQPRQLHALITRWERAAQIAEFMPAQIAACIVNFSMGRQGKPVKPWDFMPSERTRRDAPQRRKQMRSRKLIAMEIERQMDSAMAYQERQVRHG